MNEGRTHSPWATTPLDRRRAEARVEGRPDRVALWAFFLALFAIVVAASTAHAAPGSGGVSPGGTPPATSGPSNTRATSSGSSGSSADQALVAKMSSGSATYYKLFGGRTACGQRLTKRTIGVANNSLPCGTKVTFAYKGHVVRAAVIDRGGFGCSPYWDLTYGLKQRLHFPGSGSVKYAVASGKAAC